MSTPEGRSALTSTTSEHAAAERRAAARALLATPILAAAGHAEDLKLVRRHKVALRQTFQTLLGYPLVVEPTFARLVKAVPPVDVPARGARRGNGGEFTPRAYTYLALVCAGLMAPGAGEQVLLSALVEQLRADAATAGITMDETLRERRALVVAIDQLIEWGVLVETDGSVAGWGERREEALLTVNQSLLPHVVARPLAGMDGPKDMWSVDPAEREQPRPALRRRLTEHPLVRRETLTEAEADALSRERRDVTRALDDAFGLALEVRLEGALAYDPDDELTDVEFPGQGTVRQAALLLLDALVDTLNPTAGTTVLVDGAPVPGVLASWDVVAENVELLCDQNSKAWRAEVAGDLGRLTDEVAQVLWAVSLATPTDDGLVLHPACSRYRPEPVRTATRTRAQRRLADDDLPIDAADGPLSAEADTDADRHNQEQS
ncbi:MAG TPA: TIGR02678 family protein [Nocardioides sp.]|uniref:TIGR02678 family protein n=1 Tax=Nocardioides sp. TaxID=35761 RepID=UPI002BC7D5A9|nr:TIGR02678 family protein [Nocardioides sp.]HTW16288.1 TIGR02678 family protein [Nocardioides sp.]